jgi:aarF domain-containing kinase
MPLSVSSYEVCAIIKRVHCAVLEQELGRPVDEVYSAISPEPVAAASLGQVYKATLRATGQEVAVKVQRPLLLETLALDLFILRSIATVAKRVRNVNSDLPGLLDEWATSIYRETSYRQEFANGVEFKRLFRHYSEVR